MYCLHIHVLTLIRTLNLQLQKVESEVLHKLSLRFVYIFKLHKAMKTCGMVHDSNKKYCANKATKTKQRNIHNEWRTFASYLEDNPRLYQAQQVYHV